MAFAIIDNLGAVLVIAFFYSTNIIWWKIIVGSVIVVTLFFSKLNYYSKYVCFITGVVIWILFLKSGIHSTIAGVLMALTIPLQRKTDTPTFYERGRSILEDFLKECTTQKEKTVLTKKQLEQIDELEELTEKAASPLQYLEHRLHGWVSYLIMPVFALANAGVILIINSTTNVSLAVNIAISMVVGNLIGIFSFS
jgi:NhaA family Na+:H+ antiporter